MDGTFRQIDCLIGEQLNIARVSNYDQAIIMEQTEKRPFVRV
jgi:hypothetical protein